jgi:hypothetical protein
VGNILPIFAQLVDKNTQQPTPFGPDKMTFSLVQVSHEPGVAMNWPAKANLISPSPPDMSFASLDPTFQINEGDPTLVFDSPDGTQAHFTPTDPSLGNQEFTMYLIPYDWGGWATLTVTATLNGQEIPGHLVVPGIPSDPNETNILLPNRQPSSSVADSWKAAHGALGLADNDDSESQPQGDSQAGDGLTLYEEYRGFYMGKGCGANRVEPQPEGTPGAACQHVEGDPKLKDVFIVDQIGVDEGMALFQFGSGLNIHYKGLTTAEIGAADTQNSSAYRVINFNNLGLPLHIADQHAIVVQWATSDNVPSKAVPIPGINRPGLPREIDHVEIATFYKGLDPNLEIIAVTVAHELSHSVDVWHHGDIERLKRWSKDSSGNLIEQSYDSAGNFQAFPTTNIYLMTEDQDPSQLDQALTSEDWGLLPRNVWVGNNVCVLSPLVLTHGQHSGDALSFMRYNLANFYIPVGFPSVRMFTAGEESGVDLTDHPAGTGVNSANRTPRPRYGDADVTDLRGNDRSQVDVNDNNTAIVRPLQGLCP